MKGIFSVLVENQAGVLSQIAGLFARRGFNIDSLAVGETEARDVSSMTIVSTGSVRTIEQIEKQLNKKLDVIKVRRLEELASIQREMLLVKVAHTPANRGAIAELCLLAKAQVVFMNPKHMIIELQAAPDKVENFIELIRPFGIKEIQRTGTVALSKE